MARGERASYIAGDMRALPLHSFHAARGSVLKSESEVEFVASAAPRLEGWKAAQEAAVLYDHSGRELITVTGEDRVSFVHGMCTQDINGLAEQAATDATHVTAKGAIVADSRILKLADEVLIDVAPGRGAPLRTFLDTYLISEDAELTHSTDRFGQLGVYGPKAGEIVTAALGVQLPEGFPTTNNALHVHTWQGSTLLLLGNARTTAAGIDVLVPQPLLEQAFTALETAGALAVGRDVIETLRVEKGVPRSGAELTEKTIPMEAHLAHAISYNKGCYIGQEVIARGTFRGQMSRKLVGLLLGEKAPAAGTELFVGDRRVGWLTSVVHSPARNQHVALGYVNRNFLEAGTVLTLAGEAGEVTVAELPLVS